MILSELEKQRQIRAEINKRWEELGFLTGTNSNIPEQLKLLYAIEEKYINNKIK